MRGTHSMMKAGVFALAAVFALPVAATAAGPTLTARAAIVMDAQSGEVLWEENATTPLPPASTTKVMTAILGLESGQLDESFRVSGTAAAVAPSKISLRPGQRMRLRDLLYALLLNSANDAAQVIAEGLAGSQDGFSDRMNARAEALGARTAHFENPHGLTAPGHVASARDMALIFRHGLGLPHFRDILETGRLRVPVESVTTRWVLLRSHNRLLSGSPYPVIGKTGYTRLARRCFVGAATHEGREIIIAFLGASDLWGDARRLFAYGFGASEDRPPLLMAGMLPVTAPTPRATSSKAVAEGDDEATVRTSRYAVQLGPYRSRRTATVTRARLAKRGYGAAISGRTVRLGSFSTQARARRLANRLRSSGYRPLVIALR